MNVLICDDDKYVRKMLEEIISENTIVRNIFVAEDGLEAVKIAGNKKIDVALLDIDMPNLDGIESAKIIKKTSPKTKFAFITAHMEYAVSSFCVHPYDYLLKPIDVSKLKDTLNDLLTMGKKAHKENGDDKIAVKNKGEISIVSMKDILYFEKVGKEVSIHTCKEMYTLDKTLSELESKLNKDFLRVHKSFIVNTKEIKKIKNIGNRSYQIEFIGADKVAFMSRYSYEELKEKIITFL